MNTVTKRLTIILVFALVGVTACSGGGTQHPVGSSSVPTASASQDLTQIAASSAAVTPAPDATPNPTETARAIFAATSRAVSSYLATQGVPPDQIGPYSQATMEALGMLPSATPYPTSTPFPVPFPVSTRVSQFGTIGYTFADPEDIRRARRVYESYFDFISFRSGPPPENLAEALAQYISPDANVADGKSDCGYSGVLSKIEALAREGYYLRLTLQNGVMWDDDQVHLFVFPDEIETVMGTKYIPNLLIEQVEIRTGTVIKQKVDDLASSAHLEFDQGTRQWILTRDENGFYCSGYYFFVGK